MRIIVAESTIVPLLRGGGTAIVDDLVARLRGAGHEVDTILIPFASDQPTMTQQMLGLRLLEVSQAWGTPDRDSHAELPPAAPEQGRLVPPPSQAVVRPVVDGVSRPAIHRGRHPSATPSPDADNLGLREARRVFSNSQVVADRLMRFNGVRAEVSALPTAGPARRLPVRELWRLCLLSESHRPRQAPVAAR